TARRPLAPDRAGLAPRVELREEVLDLALLLAPRGEVGAGHERVASRVLLARHVPVGGGADQTPRRALELVDRHGLLLPPTSGPVPGARLLGQARSLPASVESTSHDDHVN